MMIHRYWTRVAGKTPPLEPWLGHVVKDLHPDDDLLDWDDASLIDNDIDVSTPNMHEATAPQMARHRSNTVRWTLLERFGGLYLDHDLIPTATLPTDRAWTSGFFGCRVSAALCFPEPHHPLTQSMLHAIAVAPPGPTSPFMSGDRLLNKMVRRHSDVGLLHLRFDKAGRLRDADSPLVHAFQTGTTDG